MPEPAWTGRPRIFCSDGCRDRAAAIREAERDRRELERYQAEREARRKARDEKRARREEREYQRAIAAGGAVAANARWERLYSETLAATGCRYGLCQWEDEDGSGGYLGRRCTRRTADVYCAKHSRVVDREAAEYRRRKAQLRSDATPRPRTG